MPNSLDREAFEAKFSQPPYEFEMDRCGPDSSWPGGYREYHVQCAWEGWQAGAAAERQKINAEHASKVPHAEMEKLQSAVKVLRDRSAP